MKTNMQEGTDYMLVDKNIYSFWLQKYGTEENELKRFGIVDDSGEAKVELFLKVFNMYAIPNTSLFKLDKFDSKKAKQDDSLTIPIYISKCSTLTDLKKKICRVLSSHLYFVLKNKSVIISDLRLWKSSYEESSASKKIRELDKKYVNYTQADIEAVNIGEDMTKKLYEINFEDTDILIVETPKGKDYVFQNKRDEEEDEDQDQVQESVTVGKNLSELDMDKVYRKGSKRGLVGL